MIPTINLCLATGLHVTRQLVVAVVQFGVVPLTPEPMNAGPVATAGVLPATIVLSICPQAEAENINMRRYRMAGSLVRGPISRVAHHDVVRGVIPDHTNLVRLRRCGGSKRASGTR